MLAPAPKSESGGSDRASGAQLVALTPGAWLSPDLRLVSRLGAGGMGSVWLADHAALGHEVAVKFIAPELVEREDSRERFKREAKSVARLKCQHVVRVFDYVEPSDGLPYIVMERLEGENLHQRLTRRGALTLEQTGALVIQAAAALEEAHALGIVHRDIKPENLFLSVRPDGLLVKIVDFGVALETGGAGSSRITSTGTALGTPIYMSPEQIQSARNVDHRCDLWSLAVVAYLCLTGKVLFEGETFGAVCMAIQRARVPPPSGLRRSLPAAMDAWFARALARDIDARFQTAREMADAFEKAMEGEMTSLTPSMLPGEVVISEAPTLRQKEAGPRSIASRSIASLSIAIRAVASKEVVAKPSWRVAITPLVCAAAVMLVVSRLDSNDKPNAPVPAARAFGASPVAIVGPPANPLRGASASSPQPSSPDAGAPLRAADQAPAP